MADEPRWITFDPTIHAGHIITVITIIGCTAAAWFGIQNDVSNLKAENANRQREIAEVKADAKAREKATEAKFDNLVQVQREEVGKLRDDMTRWFMNLDQKLDRKADKR